MENIILENAAGYKPETGKHKGRLENVINDKKTQSTRLLSPKSMVVYWNRQL